MSNINYTEFNEKSTKAIVEDAVDFINNPDNFRSFDIGLIELLKRKNFDINNKNEYEMADYLYNTLQKIGSVITKSTVESWFLGEHRPKIEAGYRKQIYEICFAMNLSYEETMWFFQHVYYDRAFNCHTIEEAVYFYAINNNISYQEALIIIETINNTADTPTSATTTPNYTQFVQQRLQSIKTTDELISFLTLNKENFNSWNITALDKLTSILQELIPSEKGKKEIDNIKRTIIRKDQIRGIIPPLSKQTEWGLVMQEFFFDLDHINKIKDINGKNIRSNSFVLYHIIHTSTAFSATNLKTKKPDTKITIPSIVRNNFPSKKTMSDILSENKITHSKSYDAIRKMIILLYFYKFWVYVKLNPNIYDSYTENELSTIYIDETNEILYSCGYEDLYPGNPYDWIFLYSCNKKLPLYYFRDIIIDLLPDDE